MNYEFSALEVDFFISTESTGSSLKHSKIQNILSLNNCSYQNNNITSIIPNAVQN